MTNYTKPWAAGYLHRAVQLARDEAASPEQVDRAVEAIVRVLADGTAQPDVRAGAEMAPNDVRSLSNGAREWVLLSAANYRNASAAVNAHSPMAERARLIAELQGLVLASTRESGAAALVKRMSDNWRVSLPRPMLPEAPPAPAMAVSIPLSSPVIPPSSASTPASSLPPQDPPPISPPAILQTTDDLTLPTPDPSWFRVIADHRSARVTSGAKDQPGTTEYLRRQTWAKIAEWMQALTSTVLGADWFAEPHRNWQNSGYLNGYYWAKLYPRVGDYGTLFNVGVQIAHRVQWADELDGELATPGAGPLLALWVTTNDNAIASLQQSDPSRMERYRQIYRTEMDRAFEEWPELWLDGGANVRWYRRVSAKKRVSHLAPALRYRDEVRAGRLDPASCTPDIWSPLLPLEDAMADPGRTAAFIARYLPPFGAILQATYSEMARTES